MVAIGSILAAILRWQIDDIFFVNILGCFILGFINTLSIPQRYKLIFGVGFCGSMTTFSGWMINVLAVMQSGNFYKAFFLLAWSDSIIFILK